MSDLVGIYLVASLTVQLTQDHQNHQGGFLGWYPYLSALLLFVITLESSIDKRQEIIQEATKWSPSRFPFYQGKDMDDLLEHVSVLHETPESIPDVRFWQIVPAAVLPIFLFLFIVPSANVPYVYMGFRAALAWLFHLRYVGLVLQVIAGIWGVLMLLGCLKYLIFRVAGLSTPATKSPATDDA